LKTLKAASVKSNNLWKAAGKPRQGPIFQKRQQSRSKYRHLLRERERRKKLDYTNALHEGLLKKDSRAFWKTWRSKFEKSSFCGQVDQCVDDTVIVDKFANYFDGCYTCNNVSHAESLRDEYLLKRSGYCSMPLSDCYAIDTELVSQTILNLHCGKAPDITGLTAEHLIHSHPSVSIVLAKLFQLILVSGVVPAGFKHSYIIPVPNIKDCRTKAMSCDDFRGIVISPVISKVFEYCLIDRFQDFLKTGDSLGSKRRLAAAMQFLVFVR